MIGARSGKNRRTRTVKVVTRTTERTYEPYYWEDISSPFPDLGRTALTRLTFSKVYTFADAESAQHFEAEKANFISANNHYDKSFYVNENFNVSGYEDNVLACEDATARPSWLSVSCFALSTCFCCGVPFRMLFAAMSHEIPK